MLTFLNALVQRQLKSIAEGVEVCNLTGDVYHLHVYVCSMLVTSRFFWNLIMEHIELTHEMILLGRPTLVGEKYYYEQGHSNLASFWWVCNI